MGSIALLAGLSIVIIGIVTTLLMFETLGRRGAPSDLRTVHRWLGRIFVIVAIALFVYMVPMLGNIEHFKPSQTFHAVLGLTLLPLIAWKVLIAWRYKKYMGILPALGFAIMVVTFVAISLTAGPEIFPAVSH